MKDKLSTLQHETLVGVLLGDGSLKGNVSKTKYALMILQSQRLRHIKNMFFICMISLKSL